MKKSRYSESQIVKILKEVEGRLPGQGGVPYERSFYTASMCGAFLWKKV